METLREIVRLEIWLGPGGLIGVAVYQMLTGRINLHGLLSVKDSI